MDNFFFSIRTTIKRFASGSNVLIVATLLALVCANVPGIREYYNWFWELPVELKLGSFNLFSHNGHPMTMLEFVNDALMAVFFFSIGCEIKREVLIGELSSFRQALLPIIAACGGMIFPVLVFYGIGIWEGGDFLNGCAIPMATDIAFSLGVLTILGKRVPISLKVFLTTLAVADDIGGILVIAIFYGSTINFTYLLSAFGLLLFLAISGSVFHIRRNPYYIVFGIAIWYLFVNSGIHPTISGVLIAFCVPATPKIAPKSFLEKMERLVKRFPVREEGELETRTMMTANQLDWVNEINTSSNQIVSPLQKFEEMLAGVVNMFIIPFFAFANAGIYMLDMEPSAAYSGVALAIIGGLFIGKFTGIFLFSWATIKCGFARMPLHSTWKMLASVSMLGGIGFTVSLFIATLSFKGPDAASVLNDAKLGIILGSLISGIVGFLLLKATLPKEAAEEVEE